MSPMTTGRRLLDAKAILSQAGLDLDMHYADFGAGSLGHFVFPASDMVGQQGKVYAVDILKSALNAISNRSQLEQVHNIETVWGDMERENGVRIPPESVHVISMVNNGSLIRKSPQVLQEVHRALRPNGYFIVVDWEPVEQAIGPPLDSRISSERVQQTVEQAGFRYIKSFEAGPHHWGMLFKGGIN